MNRTKFKINVEAILHLLFWILLFSSINVDWTSDWLDKSIRPKTPAPLSVLIFPLFFYVNAFVLIPRYFSFEKWKTYCLYAILLFFGSELLRILVYRAVFPETTFGNELFSRDSFLFGAPSVFFIALNTSFVYRFAKDWFANKKRIRELQANNQHPEPSAPYENANILSEQEAQQLEQAVNALLDKEELFLKPDLTLRDLAENANSTEKKISYLLNQHIHSNFYEMVNERRIERFKIEAAKPENQNLSIVGLALNCGFSSKSSFYRAFKSSMGISPSEYIKQFGKGQ